MKKSLSDLQKAIKGTVVMSIQLENMFLAFLDKKSSLALVKSCISFIKAAWFMG